MGIMNVLDAATMIILPRTMIARYGVAMTPSMTARYGVAMTPSMTVLYEVTATTGLTVPRGAASMIRMAWMHHYEAGAATMTEQYVATTWYPPATWSRTSMKATVRGVVSVLMVAMWNLEAL